MTREVFFCYERSSVDGHWTPRIFYDDPSKMESSTAKDARPARSKIHIMTLQQGEQINANLLSHYEKMFPAPIDEKEK